MEQDEQEENNSRHEPISPRIQKQISMFEKELQSQSSNSSTTNYCRRRRPSSPPLIPNRRNKFENLETFFMSQSSSNTNLSHYVKKECVSSSSTSKFKSCSNLKVTVGSNQNTLSSNQQQSSSQQPSNTQAQQHHPGALIVKQMFIEPPKRISRRFGHGKTQSMDCDFHFYDDFDSGNLGSSAKEHTGSCSARTSPRPPQRFTTNKIDEAFNQKDEQ